MDSTIERPGFKDPIRYLSFVHRRMGEEMGKLAYYLELKHGAQLAEVEEIDIRNTLDYLRKIIPLHASDEEASLYPHMLSTANPAAEGARTVMVGLEREQRVMVDLFSAVEGLFMKWVEETSLTHTDLWNLRRQVTDLRRALRHHVFVEESHVFPLAEKVLCGTCRTGIVQEMLERRGLEDPLPV
jgi:hemerythrin-like domain-containing protein